MSAGTVNFTEPQKQAITSRGRTLLVSAGAGSGKTSVLTERIIQKITAKENQSDITDFLIVTFTKASAADLKNKISKAINKKLSEDFGNVHLKRQQLMLGRANISTIHSFYLELIQNNFEKLGLPAKFRLADSNEISVIRRQTLDALLEEYYSEDSEIYKTADFSREDFTVVVENFITSRDDANIYNVILNIYNKLSSSTDKFEIFEKQIFMLDEILQINGAEKDFFKSQFGKTLMELFSGNIDLCIKELSDILDIIEGDEKLSKKYSPAASNKMQYFDRLKKLINYGSYDGVAKLCQDYKKIKVGSHRIDNAELKDYINDRNALILKRITEINKYFEYKFDDIRRFAEQYKKIIVILYDFIKRFEASLLAEKIRLRTFEFSDLEYFAFKLLVEKIDGGGAVCETDTARQLKNRFKEIFIDEYQDTNKLQDTIFKAISTEENLTYANGNRFMVGDIKQSIYAFRGAKSDIFSFYSKLFGEFPESHELSGKPQKIYMQDNFRSSYNIINFINYIFGELFSEKLGGLRYKGGEVLEYGGSRKDIDEKSIDTTFALVEKMKGDHAADIDSGTGTETSETDEDTENENESENDDADTGSDALSQNPVRSAEAEYVALTIKELLECGRLKNGEKILPQHITVLMRSTVESGLFAEALKKYGVPSHTDKTKGFLESAEIMLMISLLKAVDNPHGDIPLAAVMKSPVFEFTLDDLVYLKIFCDANIIGALGALKKENLYYCVKAFAESETEDIRKIEADAPYLKTEILHGKCRRFLETLKLWRMKSRIMTVDKFVWYLYRQTNIFLKISGDGFSEERRGNLLLLHEYARQFEATSFNGLYGFLNYLDDVKAGEDDFEKSKVSSENSGVVRIMSVHKSKGLEFPVCILANTGKKFNGGDYTIDPIINENAGIYFKLKCEDGIGFEKPVFRKVAGDIIKAESLSEEARILYVALTRAMEKLIVVGSTANSGIDSFLSKYTFGKKDDFKKFMIFEDADCTLKWLTPIILDSDGRNRTSVNINVDLVYNAKLESMIAKRAASIANSENSENIGNGKSVESGGADKLPESATLTNEESKTVDEYAKVIRKMYDYKYKHEFLSKVPVKLSISNLHPGILDNDEYSQPFDTSLSPLPRFLDKGETDAGSAGGNAALTGTAMHLFMQFANFENAEKTGVESEAKRLLNGGFISGAQYLRLNFDRLGNFFKSNIYLKIKSAQSVYREMKFALKIPAAEFSETGRITDIEEYILIQGVIDLFFIDKNGDTVVLDFKTDFVKKDGGEEELVRRHAQQLKYYRRAAEEMLNKPVRDTYIYSFTLGKEIAVV